MLRLLRITSALGLLLGLFSVAPAFAQIRDGGIDPWNLGKGDWIYFMNAATNKLGRNISSVTNENSLMLFYRSVGIRYIIVKAGTGASLFNGSYSFPQFTSNLVNVAHANGILIFGYSRSYATNVAGEVAIANYVFNHGADGFVWDAESEWESGTIGSQGPTLAWQQCSTVRSNWPNKFLAHAPFPIISYHASFPYKEFGYWCDAVMPQIYPANWTNVKSRPSGGINWTDVNFHNWQNSLVGQSSVINGQTIYWTNSIKPLAPANHVYGPNPPNSGVSEIPPEYVMEFIDYLDADPHSQTVGGYKGANFWRADLHGAAQWSNIQAGTSGSFTGIVNNIVIDDGNATKTGAWTSTRTFYNGVFYGNGSGRDTNSFGTNYLTHSQGTGAAYVQFTPSVLVPGNYDLFEWHAYVANASVAVPFVITSSGGTTTNYVNQQTNAGKWSYVGRYSFNAGTSGNVQIMDSIPEAGGVVVVDGLKLMFAGALAQPPPAAPMNLAATAVSASRIDLAWIDAATNETGFVVARGTNSGGPYVDLPVLPANSTNYSDIGVSDNTTYHYVVRSVNDSASSSNSPEAVATTFAVAPLVQIQPLSQSVFLGQTAGFVVSVGGSQPFYYQWQFNGGIIPGATGSTYTISSAVGTNSGFYSVSITNIAGTATSSNASLTVLAVAASGDNSFGQLNVPAASIDAISVAAGEWHSMALRSNGSVLAWGSDFQGQCSVPASLTNAVAIAAGGYHSLAINTHGRVIAWGADDYAQCSVPNGVTNALAIAAGTWHSVALLDDGSVAAWGDNTVGQTDIPPGLSDVVAIAARGNHNLALRADGSVVAWGDNADSDGFFAGQSVVPEGLTNAILVAAGNYHSLAVKSDGSLIGWGDNSSGQCNAPAGLTYPAMLAGGGHHDVALNTNGTAIAWGSDYEGQCDLPTGMSAVLAVAAGAHHSLTLFDSGTFRPWLFSSAWSGAGFTVRVQTEARKSYALEFKDSLAASNWSILSTNHGNGALVKFVDPGAPPGRRLYRVRQW